MYFITAAVNRPEVSGTTLPSKVHGEEQMGELQHEEQLNLLAQHSL